MGHTVFLSYSTKDKAIVLKIKNYLEKNGISCWLDTYDILPSQCFADKIVAGIKKSKVLILVLSSASIESEYVINEVVLAYKYKLPILPVKIEKVTVSGALEFHLVRVNHFDAIEGPIEGHLFRLTQTLRKLLSRIEPPSSVKDEPKRRDKPSPAQALTSKEPTNKSDSPSKAPRQYERQGTESHKQIDLKSQPAQVLKEEHSGLKILWVDEFEHPFYNDPFLSEVESSGYDVTVAETGDEAISYLSSVDFDLIILETMLPHSDKGLLKGVRISEAGLRILDYLRNGNFGRNRMVPALLASGYPHLVKVYYSVADALAPIYFLPKPFWPRDLVEEIEKIFYGEPA
jgi:CheY-like chemotaxis protein